MNHYDDSLYKKSYFRRTSELGKLAPDSFKAFNTFTEKALEPGALSGKLKELIAVAVAHVTGCPYCIDVHVPKAKEQQATKEEISEAVFVATALKAGSAFAHGVNALNALDEEEHEALYKAAYFKRISEFSDLNGDAFKAFVHFDQQALKPGKLSGKEKELIAVAVAHTTGCPYCIDLHTKAGKKAGAVLEEIAEAIFVAAALKAGAAFAHGVNALNAYTG